MNLDQIYSDFKSFNTNREKIEYLQFLQSLNLSYHINYENLINHYSKS